MRWTRDELLIVLNLYHKLRFGQLDSRQPVNVRNGICLNRLHDAAFDQGLIAFDDELRLILSARLKSILPHDAVKASFEAHEGKSLDLPDEAFPPDAGFLDKHRKIFKFAA
jgi:putative restriction endonuclease